MRHLKYIAVTLVTTALTAFLTSGISLAQIVYYGGAFGGGGDYPNPVETPNYDETPEADIEAQRSSGVCEGRSHEYWWWNTSTNTSDYEYIAIIHGYAVVLDDDPHYTPAETGNPEDDDFLNNVDTSTLLCTDGGRDDDGDGYYEATYGYCDFDDPDADIGEELYSGSEWGGTTVTYEELDFLSGRPRGLHWEYAQNYGADENDMPLIEAGEWWYAGGISFEAIDYTVDLQTATTSGWIEVEFWEYDIDAASWSRTYPVEVDADRDGDPDDSTIDPDGDYEFWWGINDVNRSIWPDCEAACSSMTVTTDPDPVTAEDAEGTIEITVDTTDTHGDDWEGTYTYSSDGTCVFTRYAVGPTMGWGSNPLSDTTSTTVYAYDCTPGEEIQIIEVDYEDDCNGSFSIEDACDVLEITSPITSPVPIEYFDSTLMISIDVDAASGETWDGEYTYTAYDSNGDVADGRFHTSYYLLNNFPAIGSNPYTTEEETVYFLADEGADVATIEVTETTWANCTDLLTAEAPYCEELTVSPSSFGAEEIEDSTYIEFTISVTDQAGDPWESTYEIYSTEGTCQFTESESDASAQTNGSNPLTTTTDASDLTIYAYGCVPGETIYIDEINYPEENDCAATITSEEGLACVWMDISPTEIEDLEAITEITIATYSSTETTDIWEGTYEITTDATGTCLFTETYEDAEAGLGTSNLTTTSNTIYVYGCSEGDTITIVESDYSDVCLAEITIPTEGEEPYCGDGIIQEGEECDDGELNGTDESTCSETCTLPEEAPYCGDGIIQEGEECDDGELNGTDESTCSETCTLPSGGDACYNLSIDPSTTASTYVTFTITPNPSSWPGPWTWTTTNPNSGFIDDDGIQWNEITTEDTSLIYNGAVGDIITVYEAGPYADICVATATIISSGGHTPGGGGNNPTSGGDSHYCEMLRFYDPEDFFEDEDDLYFYSIGDTFEFEGLEAGDEISFTVEALNEMGGAWEGVDDHLDTIADSDYEWEWTADSGTITVTVSDDADENENSADYEVDEQTFTVIVQAGSDDSCMATFIQTVEEEVVGEPEDSLSKAAETFNFGWMNVGSSSLNGNCFSEGGCDSTYAHDFDYVFYEIAYTPDPDVVDEVTIVDTIVDDIIGENADSDNTTDYGTKIEFYTADGSEPSSIITDYVGSGNDMAVVYSVDGTEIPTCESITVTEEDGTETVPDDETCYEGSIADSTGITLINLDYAPVGKGNILIRYLGQVWNGDFQCDNPEVAESDCPVHFYENTASTDDGRLSDSADITIICPFLLTRNAGEVYIEGDLSTYDVSCYFDAQNTDALVLSRSWDLLSRFSSYITETVIDLTTVWQKVSIQEQASEQVDAITRYNEGLENILSLEGDEVVIRTFQTLEDILPEYRTSDQNVYRVTENDLVFDLNGELVPEGAYTFIVENHDLYIRSDILYSDVSTDVTDLKSIPSIAFIVLGGDVYITSNVEDIVGVFYLEQVEQEDGTLRGGQMTGDWTDPFTTLTIYGSVYGDINSLLGQRTFAGPINYDHGNVVLRYDERIFLNTPPGLEEYVDIESERTVR